MPLSTTEIESALAATGGDPVRAMAMLSLAVPREVLASAPKVGPPLKRARTSEEGDSASVASSDDEADDLDTLLDHTKSGRGRRRVAIPGGAGAPSAGDAELPLVPRRPGAGAQAEGDAASPEFWDDEHMAPTPGGAGAPGAGYTDMPAEIKERIITAALGDAVITPDSPYSYILKFWMNGDPWDVDQLPRVWEVAPDRQPTNVKYRDFRLISHKRNEHYEDIANTTFHATTGVGAGQRTVTLVAILGMRFGIPTTRPTENIPELIPSEFVGQFKRNQVLSNQLRKHLMAAIKGTYGYAKKGNGRPVGDAEFLIENVHGDKVTFALSSPRGAWSPDLRDTKNSHPVFGPRVQRASILSSRAVINTHTLIKGYETRALMPWVLAQTEAGLAPHIVAQRQVAQNDEDLANYTNEQQAAVIIAAEKADYEERQTQNRQQILMDNIARENIRDGDMVVEYVHDVGPLFYQVTAVNGELTDGEGFLNVRAYDTDTDTGRPRAGTLGTAIIQVARFDKVTDDRRTFVNVS